MNILDKRDKSLAPTPRSAAADKAEKFKWAKPSSPGSLQLVNKNLLGIDDVYQRDRISQEAVLRIARDWDWALFGVIKVSRRPDKTLWVFDGGHRVRASFYRSDIIELPCIVFDMADLSDEARAFIAGSRMSSAISSIDTFRAAMVATEPGAMKTKDLLTRYGITVKKSATNKSELKCIHTIQKCVEEDADIAEMALIVALNMAGDSPISGVVFGAIFRAAAHFHSQGINIFDTHSEEFGRLTQPEADKAIRQFQAETGKGGHIIAAKAIVSILNKGKRTRKLQW